MQSEFSPWELSAGVISFTALVTGSFFVTPQYRLPLLCTNYPLFCFLYL